MAVQDSPDPVDVTDIQFKVHSKYQLFNINASTPNFNGIDLLATASTFGLIIVGRPASTEIQVLRLKDVVDNKETGNISVRTINMPGKPYILALSCDHTMLSVCYTANGLTFMDFYAVQSFLSANVVCMLSKVSVSNSDGVKVKQILWNPVIANTLAVCLSDGSLGAYVIKPNSFEYNSLDKSENACCACWSPKGKQIVVAFPNGKLAQYKPDLKLAKTIPCTVPLLSVPFSTVAVQWLSTYQFAAVFVEDKEESLQSLFIINAPKAVPPSYINYSDITYSQTGPRATQVFLIHILQWNLLLMASSNSTEIGALGTIETGETPLWKQYLFIDEGRAELPLTADKRDTFPIGLALETGSTHQVTIGENQIPVMPMIHILSTHGLLLSFDLLNFQPTRVDICSPPQNMADQSGVSLFRSIASDVKPPAIAQQNAPPQYSLSSAVNLPAPNDLQQISNLTFSIPATGATSTPAKPPPSQMQSKPLFALSTNNPQSPKTSSLFGNTSTSPFGGSSFNLGGSKDPPKPFVAPSSVPAPAPALASRPAMALVSATTQQSLNANAAKSSSEISQPFLTVQPTYKPTPQPAKNALSCIVSNSENDTILRKLLKEEIISFDEEIRKALNLSRNIQIKICDKDELSKLIKSIDEMQEITIQATESNESIKSDVQSMRLTLYEMLAMLAEAQSKMDEFKKMGKSTDDSFAVNQTHRRLVNKLQNILAQNQSRFDIFSKQLYANWNSHLQNKQDNDKARMRIPTLENVYQTLEKQQIILMKEKEKIKKLKVKVGVRDASPNKIKYSYSNTDNLKVNSLIDSVLSLTIGDQIKNERKLLNPKKLDSLRKASLNSRNVNLIKPSKPDRQGINSEVIIEKKLALAKAQEQKDILKKAEARDQSGSSIKKQEELSKQKEKIKQEELSKTKPMESAQSIQISTIAAPSKPKERAEKPASILKPSVANALPTNTLSKSLFGLEKPPLTFGGTSTEKLASGSVLSATSNIIKTTPFDTNATASSGFPFDPKTSATNLFGSNSSSVFSFDASTKTSNFDSTQQTKAEVLNLSKPIATTTTVEKIPLLLTPTANNSTPTLNPAAAAGMNSATKPIPTMANNIIPLNTAPMQNVPAQKPALLTSTSIIVTAASVAAPAVTAATSTTTFKFDTINAFTTPMDKSKNDKENNGLSAAIFAKASADSSIFSGSTAPTSTLTTTSSTAVSSSTEPSNLFQQGFNICKPNVADSSKGLFGSGSFGASAASSTTTASIFGGIAKSTTITAQNNLFGSKPITTIANTASSTSTATSVFGTNIANLSPSAQQSSNIFGVASFGLSASDNLFGSVASKPASNIFGGSSGTTSTSSIFGGATSASPSNSFGASPFGNANTPNTNLFGDSGVSTSSPASGGSLFGGFSSPSNAPTSPSAFGSFSQTTSNATSFGAAPTFGSPFGQAAQPAQSAFGSPQQSQSTGFGLSALAASANPTFGSGATFGATSTFGSPKGFGTFSSANPNPSFNTPQKNTLFESLGSSENAMTFSNLAQSQSTPAVPKPFSGGSSFSSWR